MFDLMCALSFPFEHSLHLALYCDVTSILLLYLKLAVHLLSTVELTDQLQCDYSYNYEYEYDYDSAQKSTN